VPSIMRTCRSFSDMRAAARLSALTLRSKAMCTNSSPLTNEANSGAATHKQSNSRALLQALSNRAILTVLRETITPLAVS